MALAWGAAMAASAAFGLERRTDGQTGHLAMLIATYFAGGALAFIPALTVGRRLARHNAMRRLATIIALAGFTIIATALCYASIFIIFDAERQGQFPSLFALYEVAIIIAASLYIFAVLGLSLYWPFGLAALAVIACLPAR